MEMMPLISENVTTLHEATFEGREDTFNMLLEKDPLILHKVSLTPFSETPLHISSLMGGLNLVNVILKRHPKMALELDSSRRSPLHLASAEGHTEIVDALLQVDNANICLACDEDGRIPLHLAAMRGRTEIIRKLISAQPNSISTLIDGDTVLHLCVKYNHLEALKVFVEIADDDLVNKENINGNSIVHLAIMLKHLEMVKYLVSVPKIRGIIAVSVDKRSLTPLEVLELGPSDFKTQEIKQILLEANHVMRSQNKDPERGDVIISDSSLLQQDQTLTDSRIKIKVKNWLKKSINYLDYDGKWIEKSRGELMIVATVIATISYQVLINPPGGVLQANFTDVKDLNFDSVASNCGDNTQCYLPGTAMFSYMHENGYFYLMTLNTVAFLASLSVIMLIISGFPLRNKIFVWCLTLAMGVAITLTAVTYLLSLMMITPFNIFAFRSYMQKLTTTATLFWLGFLSVVGAVHIIRFIYWVGMKLHKLFHQILGKFRRSVREGITK